MSELTMGRFMGAQEAQFGNQWHHIEKDAVYFEVNGRLYPVFRCTSKWINLAVLIEK